MEKVFIITFLFNILINEINTQCICSGISAAPPMTISVGFVGENEVINGTNYGVPVVYKGILILPQDILVSPSISALNSSCPLGWRAPTVNELSTLLSDTFSTLNQKLNLTDQTNYLSLNKSFPSVTDGTDNNAWMYKGLFFSSTVNNSFIITDVSTYFDSPLAVKCVFDTTTNIPLIISQKDFIQNYNYPVTIQKTNLAAISWKTNGNVVISNSLNSKSISVTFTTIGCNPIEIWAQNAAGQMLYNCRNIWVTPIFGTDGPTTISASSIIQTSTNIIAERIIYLFWNRGMAPIAPKITGGFYLLYSEKSTNNTYVAEYSSSLTQISKNNLGFNAYPLDITAYSGGFMIYVKDCLDNNKAFIVGYDTSYTQTFRKTIMNNGNTPVKITSQLSFYDKNGGILGGLEAMFSASTGKLAYGRGRFGMLFSHYNAYGLTGPRNDHQGDTYYDFDTSGNGASYGWPWKTSHSLYQTQIYNGRYFITASLGDIYPENIQVCIYDMLSYTNSYDSVNNGFFNRPTVCTNIVKGKICGDGGGNTCGRIGGLVISGDTIGLVYARKPCNLVGYEGANTFSTDNEIGLITFNIVNFQFSNLQYFTFGMANKITAIRAVKYGINIFITYITVTADTNNQPQIQYVLGDPTVETQNIMLVDFNGNVISQTMIATGNNNVSPSDDIRFLNDGTPIWGYVDSNNKLSIFSLPTPPLVNNINTSGSLDSIIIPSSNNGSSGSSSKKSSGEFLRPLNLFILFLFITLI